MKQKLKLALEIWKRRRTDPCARKAAKTTVEEELALDFGDEIAAVVFAERLVSSYASEVAARPENAVQE